MSSKAKSRKTNPLKDQPPREIITGWFYFPSICVLYNQFMAGEKELQDIMRILRAQLPELVEEYHVATLELFGSYVRHAQRKDSDLDILVTFSKTPSLLKFIRLENHLSDVLGVKVDLVMRDSLKAAIGKNILREAVRV
jgi:predicted nucleotidyltransferase